jgi:hypothetical protein
VHRQWIALFLSNLVCSFTPAAPSLAQDDAHLKVLIDRIAKGDPTDSEEAVEELVARTLDPLIKSIGSIENRPDAEVARLRSAIGQINVALRMRVARMDLPEVDRKLFDDFAEKYPLVARRLFDDNARIRLAAVQQVPLDPNSGAGVMLAIRTEDDDTSVYETALAAIGKLRDPVAARGLTRSVARITKGLQAEPETSQDTDLELREGYGVIAQRAILEIAKAKYADGLPTVIEAVRYFAVARRGRWFEHMVAPAILSLVEFKDEQVVPLLVTLLDDPRAAEMRSPGVGSIVAQTVGDAAFLALQKLYGLESARFGMVTTEGESGITGFTDDGSRQAARQHLRKWMSENAAKPRETRTPPPSMTPTSQPAATQPKPRSDRVPGGE